MVMRLQIRDLIVICKGNCLVIRQINTPVHVPEQKLEVVLPLLLVRIRFEVLDRLSVALLEVFKALVDLFLAARQVAV